MRAGFEYVQSISNELLLAIFQTTWRMNVLQEKYKDECQNETNHDTLKIKINIEIQYLFISPFFCIELQFFFENNICINSKTLALNYFKKTLQ